jgi:type VI secretion system secreted protein Hcp
MRFRFRTTLLAAATAALLAGAIDARAASDFLLKLDGIKGESTDERHKDWIDVLSWSWGVAQLANGGSAGARVGKSCPSDLVLNKFVDSSTPPLIGSAAGGTVIPNGILIGMRQGGKESQEYLKVEMKNVFVSSFQTGGSTGATPVDSVSLRFSSMTVTYSPQKPDGTSGTPVVVTIPGC